MIKILKSAAFGVVFERQNSSCFKEQEDYQIYLNGVFYGADNRNVVSIIGLEPDTSYELSLRGNALNESCSFCTPSAGFVINVKEYNAFGNGLVNDTSAINAAIYAAPPGSVIRFPRGVYLVDSIFLKSHVDLYLEEGAVIKQNFDRSALAILKGYQKDYNHTDASINSSWEGNPLDCYCSLIYGKDVHDIQIYGKGRLDGSGEEGGWWNNPKERKEGAFRPNNLFLNNCERVTVFGISSMNSASWNLHPFYTNDAAFYDLKIISHPQSPNTDGIDPESCKNVEIVGCHFQVGDDCVAIKSGKLFMSRRFYKPCENIQIRNCFMEEGHGGVSIGSEASCGARNIHVSQCLFFRTDRGLRLKTRRGRGDTAVFEEIVFDNVQMNEVRHCFVINMFYYCDPDGHSPEVQDKNLVPVSDETPQIRNIILKNVIAKEIPGSAVFIYSLPESPARKILIEDSLFSFSENRITECPAMMDDPVLEENMGVYVRNGEDVRLIGVEFQGECINDIDQEVTIYGND